jgi:hypothetical protein
MDETDDPGVHGLSQILHVAYGGADKISLQVLAVDLLNPSPAAEAKKHKLKVRPPTPTDGHGAVAARLQK